MAILSREEFTDEYAKNSLSKTVVLLSAGLDSAVNLYAAQRESKVVLALTFNYGQRAALKEIEQSQKICEKLKIPHKVIDLPFFKDVSRSALTDESQKIPQAGEVKIDDFATSVQTAARVWVANRNGIFLNIAAAYAEFLGADAIVPGFNAEEAVTFADNSKDYLKAATAAFYFSTANHVRVKCYTIDKNKTEIAKMGRGLKVDFDLLWPCYFGGEKICEQCESCQRFLRAFRAKS